MISFGSRKTAPCTLENVKTKKEPSRVLQTLSLKVEMISFEERIHLLTNFHPCFTKSLFQYGYLLKRFYPVFCRKKQRCT